MQQPLYTHTHTQGGHRALPDGTEPPATGQGTTGQPQPDVREYLVHAQTGCDIPGEDRPGGKGRAKRPRLSPERICSGMKCVCQSPLLNFYDMLSVVLMACFCFGMTLWHHDCLQSAI